MQIVRFLLLFFLGFFLLQSETKAQADSNEVGFQMWTDYNLNVRVNKRFGYGGDVGLRGFLTNYDWNQIYIRPRITYELGRITQLATGIAYFRTNFFEDNNIHEFRLFQDLVFTGPNLNFIHFQWRLRFEERFFAYENIPNDWYIRARYMAVIETKDFNIGGQKFHATGMYEGFQPVVNQSSPEVFIDQIRIKAVIGHRVSPSFRYELHYMWQNTRQYSENGFETDNNVFRIRLFHTIWMKKEGTTWL